MAKIFRQAQREGKQLWYFTAPSSVPITVVEKMQIPLDRAQKGLPILNHDGQNYSLSFDDALSSKTIKLMIPNKAGDRYAMRSSRPLSLSLLRYELHKMATWLHGYMTNTLRSQTGQSTRRCT